MCICVLCLHVAICSCVCTGRSEKDIGGLPITIYLLLLRAGLGLNLGFAFSQLFLNNKPQQYSSVCPSCYMDAEVKIWSSRLLNQYFYPRDLPSSLWFFKHGAFIVWVLTNILNSDWVMMPCCPLSLGSSFTKQYGTRVCDVQYITMCLIWLAL